MSTEAPPVLFIIGSGGRVGKDVAATFAKKGYRVPISSRSLKDGTSPEAYLTLNLDAGKTEDIKKAFGVVRDKLGSPTVVVYNAYAFVPTPSGAPFAIPAKELEATLAVNAVSVHAAAHEFIQDHAKSAGTTSTFILTGNALNDPKLSSAVFPEGYAAFYSLGLGKSAGAHLIIVGAQRYGSEGARFYYADERSADGGPMYNDISGTAHADEYWTLVQQEIQSEPLHTFVKGKGYQAF